MNNKERYRLKIEIWNNRKEYVHKESGYDYCVYCERNLYGAIIHNDSYCYFCFMKRGKFTDQELIIESEND